MARKKNNSKAFWYVIGGVIALTALLVFFTGDSVATDFSAYDFSDEEFENPEAEFVIEKFNDFQCPACRSTAPLLRDVRDNHDNVHIHVRHFPLAQFPHSENAAEAAECARDQDRFWAMYYVMFDHQERLTPVDVNRYARGIGLDMDAFSSCLENRDKQLLVTQDQQEGLDREVSGTPTIFINGERVQFGTAAQFASYISQHQQN